MLRQFFDIHTLSLQLGFEQRQLFFRDLLTALTASCGEQLPQKVLSFDAARLFGVQLRDQIEHHTAQCSCVVWQLFLIDGH